VGCFSAAEIFGLSTAIFGLRRPTAECLFLVYSCLGKHNFNKINILYHLKITDWREKSQIGAKNHRLAHVAQKKIL